ncbi:IclR family transcriptional regulator [Paraburkholderia caribensis]|uniref:IclR family transcriptional regulator n=1 Tax=Paraburkholderia caribensis TaxID=75105 RepID=UPI001CC5B107|nr:IclR family transcriptional regulator [Paraburkholderia caribensis]
MKTVATALRILEQFADGAGQRSVSEIAEYCQLPPSQVSRILSTFGRAGWLDQDARTRKYSVGLPAYVVGSRFVQFHPLTKHAIPILRGIVDRSGFNTTLSILDHLKPLYLLGIAGPVPVELSSAFGSYFPFHATAAGKVLAAFAPHEVRERMLQETTLERITSRSITNRGQLQNELEQVFRRGYATSDGERVPGIGALAVPVITRSGQVTAAIGNVFPTKMVSVDEREYHVEILKSGARSLIERIEGPLYPHRR